MLRVPARSTIELDRTSSCALITLDSVSSAVFRPFHAHGTILCTIECITKSLLELGARDSGSRLPSFVNSKRMSSYVGRELREKLEKPVVFQAFSGGPNSPPPSSSRSISCSSRSYVVLCMYLGRRSPLSRSARSLAMRLLRPLELLAPLSQRLR